MAILGLIIFIEIVFLVQSFFILPFSDFFATIFPQALVDLSNQNRERENLADLKINLLLQEAAQMKADDMAAKGYFSHNSPEGATPWDWFEKAGYDFNYAGENLAVNFFDSNDAVEAWMASPGHRANILNKNYTEIGIGVAKGMYEGREAVFIAQMFGSPAVAQAALAPSLPAAPLPVTLNSAPVQSAQTSSLAKISPSAKPAPSPAKNVLTQTQREKPASAAASSVLPAVAKTSGRTESAGVSKAAKILESLSAPRKSFNYVFAAIAGAIFLAIVLKIFIKISIQHHSLVINGVILLIIIAGALVLNQYLFVARAAIN